MPALITWWHWPWYLIFWVPVSILEIDIVKYLSWCLRDTMGLPWWLSGEESACQCSRLGNSWVGKIPWRRNGYPLQYSCLGNSMDRGACWATAHGVAKELDVLLTQQMTQCKWEAEYDTWHITDFFFLRWLLMFCCLYLHHCDHHQWLLHCQAELSGENYLPSPSFSCLCKMSIKTSYSVWKGYED